MKDRKNVIKIRAISVDKAYDGIDTTGGATVPRKGMQKGGSQLLTAYVIKIFCPIACLLKIVLTFVFFECGGQKMENGSRFL